MPADAEAIAAVHAQVWRETYTGLMPDELVAGAPMERRIASWQRRLQLELFPTVVAESRQQHIVAFIGVGFARDACLGPGEFQAINILRAHQRRGIGRRLMHAGTQQLLARGCFSAGLWVLETNINAHRFYEALGGQRGHGRVDHARSAPIVERSYLWADVAAALARATA